MATREALPVERPTIPIADRRDLSAAKRRSDNEMRRQEALPVEQSTVSPIDAILYPKRDTERHLAIEWPTLSWSRLAMERQYRVAYRRDLCAATRRSDNERRHGVWGTAYRSTAVLSRRRTSSERLFAILAIPWSGERRLVWSSSAFSRPGRLTASDTGRYNEI